MKKMMIIAATLLAVLTVALTTYGGDMVLGKIVTARAATKIQVNQPLENTHKITGRAKAGVTVVVKNDLGEVLGATTATQGDKFTIETDEVLEAKEKLAILIKTKGHTEKVTIKTAPIVHQEATQ